MVVVANTGDAIPRVGPAARLRALLPGREVAGPRPGRRRHRPRDRAPAGRGRRRRGRRRVARRPDPLLVQPAGGGLDLRRVRSRSPLPRRCLYPHKAGPVAGPGAMRRGHSSSPAMLVPASTGWAGPTSGVRQPWNSSSRAMFNRIKRVVGSAAVPGWPQRRGLAEAETNGLAPRHRPFEGPENSNEALVADAGRDPVLETRDQRLIDTSDIREFALRPSRARAARGEAQRRSVPGRRRAPDTRFGRASCPKCRGEPFIRTYPALHQQGPVADVRYKHRPGWA